MLDRERGFQERWDGEEKWVPLPDSLPQLSYLGSPQQHRSTNWWPGTTPSWDGWPEAERLAVATPRLDPLPTRVLILLCSILFICLLASALGKCPAYPQTPRCSSPTEPGSQSTDVPSCPPLLDLRAFAAPSACPVRQGFQLRAPPQPAPAP